ncbi:MAG: TetR/AcrR family transcriptional regulator [Cryobacterium sp.]|nr:TetR/AcrR family transcriptional regulator [Cryobacterium sp.]
MPARTYRLGARADTVAQTRTGILGAFIDLASRRLTVDITLEEVADRSGVSVRTILRHFGDREGLLDSAFKEATTEFKAEREAPVDDRKRAVEVLIGHYEKRGDLVIRMLAQESDRRIGPAVVTGRNVHRQWVGTVFNLWLPAAGEAREKSIDLLVVATDVFAWKLLRRDRGLSRPEVESRMLNMVDALLAQSIGKGSSK